MPFAATWVDLEIIILNEVSQIKTNTIYVESKMRQMNLFKKQTQCHRLRKQTLWLSKGKGLGEE